jgi:mono/diheme cytochrome c family protein
MRRYLTTLTLVLLVIGAVALSKLEPSQARETPSPTQERKGNVDAGKALYIANCKKCHGEQGEGNPKMYRLVKATLVHLGSKQAQDRSDDEIRKSMTDGFGKMEAIKELTPDNVENILAFVRTLKQGEPPKK